MRDWLMIQDEAEAAEMRRSILEGRVDLEGAFKLFDARALDATRRDIDRELATQRVPREGREGRE